MSNFKLTRSEFSKKLGIPTDTLKKRMKRYGGNKITHHQHYLYHGKDLMHGKNVQMNYIKVF